MLGLVGAHRVGKTSLARAYAEKNNALFVETSVSAMFADMGLDPAAHMDFKLRLSVQEEILRRLDAIYAEVGPGDFAIADRTPIDLLGYTMAEAIGTSVPARLQQRFDQYVANCFDVLNKRFATIVLVQPGIPIVKAKGKAALNRAYIEHLNSLMFGLSCDERVKCAHYYIRRSMTDFDERLAALENAVGKAERVAAEQVMGHLAAGGYIH